MKNVRIIPKFLSILSCSFICLNNDFNNQIIMIKKNTIKKYCLRTKTHTCAKYQNMKAKYYNNIAALHNISMK